MKIRRSKRRRKCIAKPSIHVRWVACETCRRPGGRCPARDKYNRTAQKRLDKEDGNENS